MRTIRLWAVGALTGLALTVAALSSGLGAAAEGQPGNARLGPSELEAQELAEHLGLSVWTFDYSGGRVRTWLEIDEDGKTTTFPDRGGVQDPNQHNEAAKRGRILFWMEPGKLTLRIHSGASSGGASKGLPTDALWWGWKGYNTSSSSYKFETTATARPGKTLTLLDFQAREDKESAKDPNKPRTIKLRLQAEFPEGE
jgi:hypothetical protein